jgi:hypothetical protein
MLDFFFLGAEILRLAKVQGCHRAVAVAKSSSDQVAPDSAGGTYGKRTPWTWQS